MDLVSNARKSIESNRVAAYGQIMQRQIEEAIASAFDMNTVERQSLQMQRQSEARMADRGIEGSTAEQLLNDIQRQEGDAIAVLDMNRSATQRQLFLEATGLKASFDQQLYNMQMGTVAPMQPIQTPQPISPVSPSAPVAQPSLAAAGFNMLGGVVQGMQSVSAWNNERIKI
ncbi:virion core protein, T7 gp14 family [Aureimonas altamirensis]|uniref:virion core protein, T7 gp14 family n=1 Tax=Aureimonas altamirensis TaxID=370622 RepID=UPI00255237E1|nr:hypothetical protein [Aureimonas altamirensis]